MKLLWLATVAVLFFQAPGNAWQQPGQPARLEGVVMRSGSGQPIPAAQVTLTRLGKLPPGLAGTSPVTLPNGERIGVSRETLPSVTTDAKGKFVFPRLDEGEYEVQVQATGYIGPGSAVELSAGETVNDLSMELTAVGNISGRIHDASNQPVVNVPVQLLQSSYDFRGRQSYKFAGTALTNDRGEYRMYWVIPGRYYLLAGRPSAGSNPLADVIGNALDGVTAAGNEVPPVRGHAFYPGVTEFGNARAIDLQPAADLQIDLTLDPQPHTYTVRGKLIDSRNGQPPRQAAVYVTSQTPGANAGRINLDAPVRNYDAATGAITIRDLLPGTYDITAIGEDSASVGPGAVPTQPFGTMPVTVSNADINGIVLTVTPSGTIAGRISAEGQFKPPMSIDHLRVALVPVGPVAAMQEEFQAQMAGWMYQGAVVGVDGSFRLNAVFPGEYRVEVSGFPIAGPSFVASLWGNGFLRSARFEGNDILDSPLRFSGSSSGSLDIVLALGGGELSGTVTDARSQPVSGAKVVIVPERARFRSDLYFTTTSGVNGQFKVSALAPGDYKVFSWEAIEEFAWFDNDLLARSEPNGTAVHVSETAPATASVRLIPAGDKP